MEWERQRVYDFEAGREKGLEQGVTQKAIEDASNLLKMNLATPEQIAQAISLPVERVLELQKELQK